MSLVNRLGEGSSSGSGGVESYSAAAYSVDSNFNADSNYDEGGSVDNNGDVARVGTRGDASFISVDPRNSYANLSVDRSDSQHHGHSSDAAAAVLSPSMRLLAGSHNFDFGNSTSNAASTSSSSSPTKLSASAAAAAASSTSASTSSGSSSASRRGSGSGVRTPTSLLGGGTAAATSPSSSLLPAASAATITPISLRARPRTLNQAEVGRTPAQLQLDARAATITNAAIAADALLSAHRDVSAIVAEANSRQRYSTPTRDDAAQVELDRAAASPSQVELDHPHRASAAAMPPPTPTLNPGAILAQLHALHDKLAASTPLKATSTTTAVAAAGAALAPATAETAPVSPASGLQQLPLPPAVAPLALAGFGFERGDGLHQEQQQVKLRSSSNAETRTSTWSASHKETRTPATPGSSRRGSSELQLGGPRGMSGLLDLRALSSTWFGSGGAVTTSSTTVLPSPRSAAANTSAPVPIVKSAALPPSLPSASGGLPLPPLSSLPLLSRTAASSAASTAAAGQSLTSTWSAGSTGHPAASVAPSAANLAAAVPMPDLSSLPLLSRSLARRSGQPPSQLMRRRSDVAPEVEVGRASEVEVGGARRRSDAATTAAVASSSASQPQSQRAPQPPVLRHGMLQMPLPSRSSRPAATTAADIGLNLTLEREAGGGEGLLVEATPAIFNLGVYDKTGTATSTSVADGAAAAPSKLQLQSGRTLRQTVSSPTLYALPLTQVEVAPASPAQVDAAPVAPASPLTKLRAVSEVLSTRGYATTEVEVRVGTPVGTHTITSHSVSSSGRGSGGRLSGGGYAMSPALSALASSLLYPHDHSLKFGKDTHTTASLSGGTAATTTSSSTAGAMSGSGGGGGFLTNARAVNTSSYRVRYGVTQGSSVAVGAGDAISTADFIGGHTSSTSTLGGHPSGSGFTSTGSFTAPFTSISTSMGGFTAAPFSSPGTQPAEHGAEAPPPTSAPSSIGAEEPAPTLASF